MSEPSAGTTDSAQTASTASTAASTTTDTILTPPTAPVTFKRRAPKKSTVRKKATPPPSDSDSDFSDDDADSSSRPIKRRKRAAIIETAPTSGTLATPTTTLGPSFVSATGKAEVTKLDDATKQTAFHNENPDEYLARKAAGPSNGETVKPSRGPLKAPSNMRQTIVTDFAPDVCKDYKQTGFCGFGDSCKYLHAREDYAQGWQLDREWEIKKQDPGGRKHKTHIKTLENAHEAVWTKEEKEEKEEERLIREVPFKCVICKNDYKTPVVTKCGHYFCEACALRRYTGGVGPDGKKKKKEPSCAICGGRTDGVFNAAKNLQRVLDKKRQREEEKKREEEELEKVSKENIIVGGW
jgi:RING finger protein 113A